MELVTTHSTGAEEWYCPTCGRRFLMQWPPEYKKIVLDAGDQSAIHTGGKGGLQITSAQILPRDEDTGSGEKLGPWTEGLTDLNLENL